MYAHFRLARPVSDLSRSEAMYRAGLGFMRIGHFDDHDGFDGIMLGFPGEGYHLEFTYCRFHPVAPAPTAEDLLVFYLPNHAAWEFRCKAVLDAGFKQVSSLNPYWEKNGRAFEDHDGYRVVIQCANWVNNSEF